MYDRDTSQLVIAYTIKNIYGISIYNFTNFYHKTRNPSGNIQFLRHITKQQE